MAPTPPPLSESDPAYNDVVLAFLKRRGYARAEEALRKEIEGKNLPAPSPGEEGSAAAGTSTGAGTGAGGAGGGGVSASAGAGAGGPAAASNTVNLPTLVQRSSNVPQQRAAGPLANGQTPPDAHVVFNYLLQTLPPASLQALGLTAAAAANAQAEKERKAANGTNGPGGVAGNVVKVLEPMERVVGYEGLKRWVESGLEGWKVSRRKDEGKGSVELARQS